MLNLYFLILSLIPFLSANIRLLKRDKPIDLSISYIIPCHYRHFSFLEDLLTTLADQTVLPDEVIVSVSECDNIENLEFEKIENFTWPFKLLIIKNQKKLYAGLNRNIAVENSSSSLIICHDMDDLIHPQKTEIIKYLFENYIIDHLLHRFYWKYHSDTKIDSFLKRIDLDQIEASYSHNHQDLKEVHNGHCCFMKYVFDKIKWTGLASGQDVAFNRTVYLQFNNTVYLNLPLTFWRFDLGTSNYKNYN